MTHATRTLLAVTAALGVPLPSVPRRPPTAPPREGPTQAEIAAEEKRARKALKRAEQARRARGEESGA